MMQQFREILGRSPVTVFLAGIVLGLILGMATGIVSSKMSEPVILAPAPQAPVTSTV